MPYQVTVDHPNAGDSDVYIHGLGTFRNGETTEVSDEQVVRYRTMNGLQQSGIFDDEGNVVSATDENGHFETRFTWAPEPHELDIPFITITKDGEEAKQDNEPKVELDPATQAQMVTDQQEAGETPTVEAPVEVVPPGDAGAGNDEEGGQP